MYDGRILLYDVGTGSRYATLPAHGQPLTTIARKTTVRAESGEVCGRIDHPLNCDGVSFEFGIEAAARTPS